MRLPRLALYHEVSKVQYPCWPESEQLCEQLGIRVQYGTIGLGREGAAFADAILLDPAAGVPARRRFTFYHEIVHHLLREHTVELYSIISDQYESDELLTSISERLCNIGAAEFLLPRETVRSLYQEEGFSVALIAVLSHPESVSRVAACAQLTFCAPHSCIAVVCRQHRPTSTPPAHECIKIDAAFRSSKMKYPCAVGTEIASNHFLAQAFHTAPGGRIQGIAPIPFKSGHRWEVACEALRLGSQVFAFFHVDEPPTSERDQLRLPFE
jgi:hypothetical protein